MSISKLSQQPLFLLFGFLSFNLISTISIADTIPSPQALVCNSQAMNSITINRCVYYQDPMGDPMKQRLTLTTNYQSCGYDISGSTEENDGNWSYKPSIKLNSTVNSIDTPISCTNSSACSIKNFSQNSISNKGSNATIECAAEISQQNGSSVPVVIKVEANYN